MSAANADPGCRTCDGNGAYWERDLDGEAVRETCDCAIRAIGERVRWLRCPDVVGTITGRDDRGLWVVQLDRSAEKQAPQHALFAAELHVGSAELGPAARPPRPAPLFAAALDLLGTGDRGER